GGADLLEATDDFVDADAPEVESLAPGKNCRQNLMRLGGRKDEDHMWRRLLERLEQGIEGLLREHVNLIDNIDFVTAFRRRYDDRVSEASHIIDAIIRSGVNLDDVQALGDGFAIDIL